MRGSRPNNRGGFWRGASSRGRSSRGNRGNRTDFGPWQNRAILNFAEQKWYNRPMKEIPSQRLTEEEIGVTEYMSKHVGFNGIIKSRYCDFQVSEINEMGEIAKLTDISPPEPPPEEQVDEDEDLLLSKYNVEILPMETWDKINKLVVGTVGSIEKVEIDVSTSSKEDRTKIHEAVKKAFGDAIVGSTVNIDEKKLMRFEKFRKGAVIDNRVKWLWPGEYVYFIVHKENCDTMETATRIAERLRMHMKPQTLGYAGTKDRRAKTSQWFSLRKVDPRRIVNAMRGIRDIVVGNFSFHDEHLKLGMLSGNKFRIALRNVTASDDVIEAACVQLRDNGFLNYYGLQRFGTRLDVPTFHVGLQLLQGNYKEAIDLILQEHEGPLEEALHLFKQFGAAPALSAVPRHAQHQPEARLIASLAHRNTDYLTALHKVPRNTRLLYLHAYQSLVWNRCVSERLRRWGLAPAVGDLVGIDEEDIIDEDVEEEESDTEDMDMPEPTGSKSQDFATDVNAEAKASKPLEGDKLKPKIPAKVLTKEDVDSGRFTIFDVVLPLPGCNIAYPPNMVDFYELLLKEDNLTLDMQTKHRSYSMSGAYRRMSVRPEDLSWSCVRYDDPYADLIASDRDELEGRELTGIVPEGKYKAVLLTFSLPVSCYATMALRELLKVDTSSTLQAAQNNYHKRRLSPTGQNGKKTKVDEEEVKVAEEEVKVVEEEVKVAGEEVKVAEEEDKVVEEEVKVVEEEVKVAEEG